VEEEASEDIIEDYGATGSTIVGGKYEVKNDRAAECHFRSRTGKQRCRFLIGFQPIKIRYFISLS
jgi:hypothetical protein